MEEILEGLDSVPWSDLSHAYGQAGDVPALLGDLISEDQEQRNEALYRLLQSVWHQGTIYEATSYVVPFLARMLNSPLTPGRSAVALIMASIADGSSYLEAHAPLNTEKEATWREILSKQGKDFDRELELERKWVEAARTSVDKDLELLYEFLNDEEPQLRMAVASALGNYLHHAVASLKRLKNAVEIETEDYVRDAMKESVLRLETRSE